MIERGKNHHTQVVIELFENVRKIDRGDIGQSLLSERTSE
jgi:hypothetical protein